MLGLRKLVILIVSGTLHLLAALRLLENFFGIPLEGVAIFSFVVALIVSDARAIKEPLVLFGVRTPSAGPLDRCHELVPLPLFVLALG